MIKREYFKVGNIYFVQSRKTNERVLGRNLGSLRKSSFLISEVQFITEADVPMKFL